PRVTGPGPGLPGRRVPLVRHHPAAAGGSLARPRIGPGTGAEPRRDERGRPLLRSPATLAGGGGGPRARGPRRRPRGPGTGAAGLVVRIVHRRLGAPAHRRHPPRPARPGAAAAPSTARRLG